MKTLFEILKEIEEDLGDLTFFHGTNQNFNPGDFVKPPSETNNISEKGRKKNLNQVFFTLDKDSAKIYAGRAVQALGGQPHVYVIKPLGDVQWINKNKGTTVLMSPTAEVLTKLF